MIKIEDAKLIHERVSKLINELFDITKPFGKINERNWLIENTLEKIR